MKGFIQSFRLLLGGSSSTWEEREKVFSVKKSTLRSSTFCYNRLTPLSSSSEKIRALFLGFDTKGFELVLRLNLQLPCALHAYINCRFNPSQCKIRPYMSARICLMKSGQKCQLEQSGFFFIDITNLLA